MSNWTKSCNTSDCKSGYIWSSRMLPQLSYSIMSGMAGMGIGASIGLNTIVASRIIHFDGKSSSLSGDIVENTVGWIAAFYCLGATVGGFLQTPLVEWVGFKWSMAIYDVFISAGWLILTQFDPIVCETRYMVWVGRLVQGVGCGGLTLLIPMYITQITDSEIKARMLTMHQMYICLGMFTVLTFGVINISYNNTIIVNRYWSTLHLFLVYFIPESPYFIFDYQEPENVKRVMRQIKGLEFNADACYTGLQKFMRKFQDTKCSLSEILLRKHTQRVTVIGLGLMVFQQLCGVNLLIMYMEQTMLPIGDLNESSPIPRVMMICLGILQVILCMIVIELVEFCGRRTLLMISSFGMGTSLLMLIAYHVSSSSLPEYMIMEYAPFFFISSYASFYFIGWGPIVMIIFSEITTLNVMKWAAGLFYTCGKIAMFLVLCVFYNDQAYSSNSAILWMFTLACIISGFFVKIYVPETRGMKINQIEEMLADECL